LFFEKILRMIVGLFVGIWVARYLGPEQFGLFSYAQSFVGLFIAIATLGLDGIVIRELVKDESRRDKLLGTAFGLKFIGAVIVFFLLFIAIKFTNNDSMTTIFIFIISLSMIFQTFNVVDFYFQSKILSKYVVYVNIMSLFLSSIIKVFLILNEASLVAFVWVMVFDNFILALGFVYIYTREGLSLSKWYFDKILAFDMLHDSYPLILGGVVNSIYMRIDQVMIQNMLGSISVGHYAAAVKLSEAWYVIGIIISKSLFPAIINAKKVSEKLYYERIQRLFLFLIILAYIISIVVFFSSEYLIFSLYGEEFLQASNVLSIHVFSAIFVYLGVSSGRWIISENKTKLDLYRNIGAMILNIILNIILIRNYGIIGAAYASLLAYIFAFYVFDIFRKDTRRIFLLKTKALLLWK
ncbi:MAG TPA: flippase, partial [Campylobacterales bacterium]|nr:flippase [Campylobacterales bacterium]